MKRFTLFVLVGIAVWSATPPVLAAGKDLAARPAIGARPGGFDLAYDIYRGGMRLLRLDFDVGFADGSYRTDARLRTSGIVGFFFDWSLTARSDGALQEGVPAPVHHRSVNAWRGSGRTVEITWRDGNPVEITAEPPYGESAEKAADAAQLAGTMDPMSAVTAMILSAGAGAQCRPETAIFDGRRRYDAKLAPLGSRRFRSSAYAAFEGQAEGCRLSFQRIAGFSGSNSHLHEITAEVWLADIGTGTGKVPVRLEIETPWGWGFAHLSRARTAEGRLVFGKPDE